jgi:hypothetical protein
VDRRGQANRCFRYSNTRTHRLPPTVLSLVPGLPLTKAPLRQLETGITEFSWLYILVILSRCAGFAQAQGSLGNVVSIGLVEFVNSCAVVERNRLILVLSDMPPLVSRKAPNTVRLSPSIRHACRPRRAAHRRAPQSGRPFERSKIDARPES